MEPPKSATKLVLGTGGLGLSAMTVVWLYSTFYQKDVAQAALSLVSTQIAEIKIEEQKKDDKIYRELCLIRFRLDSQSGVPNPGGCE